MSTATELSEKRLKIAKYNLEDLQGFNIGRLRELASGIVPGSSRMKKAQLVEELLAATKTERVVVELIPDTSLEVVEVSRKLKERTGEVLDHEDLAAWCQSFWKEFRKLVQSRLRANGMKRSTAILHLWLTELLSGSITALENRIMGV